jgi:hypothetical protein
MFMTSKHDTHTVRSLSTPSRACQPGAAVRLCVVWRPGPPRAPCNLQAGMGGCGLRINYDIARFSSSSEGISRNAMAIRPMAGCSSKLCAQQARVVLSKVEELDEEEEKRIEEKIRFLGHPRPTARLHHQVPPKALATRDSFKKKLDLLDICF